MTVTATVTGHQIVIPGPEPLILDPAAKGRQTNLTAQQAELLTHEIQRTEIRLWYLVGEAHDRKAHTILGYKTWDDYVRDRLRMSPARSYQLLDTGHVMKAVAQAGADLDDFPVLPARVVAKVKDRLPEVKTRVRKAMKDNTSPEEAIRDLARIVETPSTRAEAASSGTTRGPSDSGVAADADDSTEARPPRGTGPVKCPACDGEGKVSRTLAPAIRAWLKDRAKGRAPAKKSGSKARTAARTG